MHIVTVNDYLAKRDAEWMGKVYAALGHDDGGRHPQQPEAEQRGAYAADITYATNNELGFDYLRDNMKSELSQMVPARALLRHRRRGRLDPDRRGADAADHLGPAQDSSELYLTVDTMIPELLPRHIIRWTRRPA